MSHGEIVVRPASPQDIAAVADLHTDSVRRHYRGTYNDAYLDGNLAGDRRKAWHARLTASDGGAFTLVADRAGAVVGFVHVVLDDDLRWGALLDNLHVTYPLKRQGIGRQLLAAAGRELRRHRPRDTRFYLWVLDQNTAAQAFYQASGGTDVERSLRVPAAGGSQLLYHRIAWADAAQVE
jgi:ribosomal protein S18 acetylase RimI-like enzyme